MLTGPADVANRQAARDTAVAAAREAASLMLRYLGRAPGLDLKSPVNLVTEIDREAERVIVATLERAFPHFGMVSEEASDAAGGNEGPDLDRPCWCVDPIDGTTNFVHGLPHCAVSIALLEQGRPTVAVVLDPAKDELFEAVRGHGARLNGHPIGVSACGSLSDALFVTGFPYDRREHLAFYLRYFERFILQCRDVRRFGSASLDLCYVAAGRFDGFWEWKLAPWDTAAGWLVVEEAGGQVSDFDGAAYDAWLPRILATNGTIHAQALELLSRLPRDP
jgi:myo-inositol-1(or 4)-monophosphatase